MCLKYTRFWIIILSNIFRDSALFTLEKISFISPLFDLYGILDYFSMNKFTDTAEQKGQEQKLTFVKILYEV